MKIAWLIAPLLLLLTDRGGSVSAEPAAGGLRKLDDYNGTLITDAKGFKDAILSASDDPMNPSKIKVDVNSDIDFDDGSMIETWYLGSYSMAPGGILVINRYFDVICVGYDETNKCTLKRSEGGGRFFRISGPSVFSFTGFQFNGGNSENASSRYFFRQHGGAVVLKSTSMDQNPVEATFIDCDFINNRVHEGAQGGAIHASTIGEGRVNLILSGCFFQDNLSGVDGGNDIAGGTDGGEVHLSCSETTTAAGTEVDVALGGKTCSSSAVPSASPSLSPSLVPSAHPVITDAKGLTKAIQSASHDITNPSKIYVDVDAVINFDDVPVLRQGLDLYNTYKFFDAICVGYDETNKCTIDRGAGGGRLFRFDYESVFSFTGFKFTGGNTEKVGTQKVFNVGHHGGAFIFDHQGRTNDIEATFIDCDFINNTAPEGAWGGAIYARTDYSAKQKLILTGCFFQDNHAGDETKGNDIAGDSGNNNGKVLLSCTETTTIPGMEVDVVIDGNSSQTCSATAVPSSAPSISNAPSTAPSTSSAPSVSASPSLNPSASPSASPSLAPSRFQGWQTITYDNFENGSTHDGWGNFRTYTEGYTYTVRVDSEVEPSDEDFIPNGTASLRIENDKGRESSIYHRKSHDVRIYSKLRVSFWYQTAELKNSDSIVLEYSKSDGNWKMMHRFNKTTGKMVNSRNELLTLTKLTRTMS